MSEFFNEMIILSLDGSEIDIHKNIEIDLTIKLNEGAREVRGGFGNALQGLVGGVNKGSIKCFGLANKIKNEFLGRKVNISLIDPKLQVEITNALISKQMNDAIISDWGKCFKIDKDPR